MFRLVSLTSFAQVACYDTSPLKTYADKTSSLLSPALKNGGYKVTKIELDSVLRQKWAIISNCLHPEWPEFALPVAGEMSIDRIQETAISSVKNAKAPPVVHAGDIVQLWSQENSLRIDTPGVSEESGGLGEVIRVRLLHRNSEDQFATEHLLGIVRGSSNVEIQR